ncbi:glycoprotein hormone alpha-2 [Coturnix japonica]|uniref:glycoprotein hormone alpha-2 n=1 Tax=Coturnix japonica TaxID=93934 RepID=UPI0013A5E342|nr:glycoprotein hormone alpha-2 [Coturnix japonica]
MAALRLFLLLLLPPPLPAGPGPGCRMRRVPQGACAVSPSLIGCSGHCESGAFPARRAVTLVTWHRVTSAARCCTIGSARKLSVTVSCPDGRSVTLQTVTATG